MEQVLEQLGVGTSMSNALTIWALMMARIMPLLLLAPFIGGDLVPAPVKMATAVAFTIMLYPFVADTRIPFGAINFILLMLKEVFIGVSIAFAALLAFEVARAAGTLVDTASGANMATVYDPHIQQQASLVAEIKFRLAIVIFLGLNGHLMVLKALLESFIVIPLNGWPKFGHGYWPFFQMVMRMTGDLLILAVALAAPAVIATFITDLTLGLINRVVPQIQVFFISMAIKPMVAVFIVLLSMTVLYERLLTMFVATIRHVQNVIILFT